MCTENEVTSVTGYIEWIKYIYETECPQKHLFFRGQNSIGYGLRPSVLRNKELEKKEKEILLDFCNYADTLGISYDKIYQVDMLLGEMQHYGIPTRLLDWSVSPLVALFFACYEDNNCKIRTVCDRMETQEDNNCPLKTACGRMEKHEDNNCKIRTACDRIEKKDGVVYMFNPWKYTKDFLKIVHPTPNNHQIQILARALMAYGWNIGDITKYLSKKYIYVTKYHRAWTFPYPTVSPFSNDRKLHQRGAFLVWGKDTEYDLKKVGLKEHIMFEYIVPHDSKEEILAELNNLYINEYTVYPDFEGMKKMFNSRHGLFNR